MDKKKSISPMTMARLAGEGTKRNNVMKDSPSFLVQYISRTGALGRSLESGGSVASCPGQVFPKRLNISIGVCVSQMRVSGTFNMDSDPHARKKTSDQPCAVFHGCAVRAYENVLSEPLGYNWPFSGE